MLIASRGDKIALQYQENGHVTLPQNQANKPLNRGTVYIYGTTNLDPNTNLLDVLYKWTPDGTGGNRQGQLLATRNYDDGQCYQINNGNISRSRVVSFAKEAQDPMGANLWCQADVSLPNNLPVGKAYTLIWVWDWPTLDRPNVPFPPSSAPGALPGLNGTKVVTPEIYTTVMDVKIVDACDAALGTVKGASCKDNSAGNGVKEVFAFEVDQDLNRAAIQNQLTNNFLVNAAGIPDADTAAGSTTAASPTATDTNGRGRTSKSHKSTSTKYLTETVYVTFTTVTVTATIDPTQVVTVGGVTTITVTETATAQATAVVTAQAVDDAGAATSVYSEVPPAVTPFMRMVKARKFWA
jgi:hypothetical protein